MVDILLVRQTEEAVGYSDVKTFRNAPSRVHQQRNVVLATMELLDSQAFRWAARELRADRDFVRDVLRVNALCLEHAAPALRADRELVLEAMKENPHAIHFADPVVAQALEWVPLRKPALGLVCKPLDNYEVHNKRFNWAFVPQGSIGLITSVRQDGSAVILFDIRTNQKVSGYSSTTGFYRDRWATQWHVVVPSSSFSQFEVLDQASVGNHFAGKGQWTRRWHHTGR